MTPNKGQVVSATHCRPLPRRGVRRQAFLGYPGEVATGVDSALWCLQLWLSVLFRVPCGVLWGVSAPLTTCYEAFEKACWYRGEIPLPIHKNWHSDSHKFRINLTRFWHDSHMHVRCVSHMSHIVSPMQQSLVSKMSQHLSQLGYVPASGDTPQYQSRRMLAHELEEAPYDSDDLKLGSIEEWAGKQRCRPPSR